MKPFILLSTAFLYNILSVAQFQPPAIIQPVKPKTTLQREGLKGYVQEVAQTLYEPAFDSLGKPVPGKRKEIYAENYLRIYNDTGNIVEEIQYRQQGVVFLRRTYEYDATDRLLEEYLYDGTGKVLNKYSFKYDLRGLPSERIVFKKNNKWVYTYDKNGNLIEEKGIMSDGKVDGITEYEYNEAGLLITETDKTPDGTINLRNEYTYDENGLIVQRIHSIKNEIKQQYTYTYLLDEYGNWIQKVEYKSGNPVKVFIRIIKYQKIPNK